MVLVTEVATPTTMDWSAMGCSPYPVGDLPLPGIAQPLQDLPRVPTQVEQTMEHLRDRMAAQADHPVGSGPSGDVFINCQDARARLKALGGNIWIWSLRRCSKSPTVSEREPTTAG